MGILKTPVKKVAVILGTASLLMLFQNCAQPDSTVDGVGMKLGSSSGQSSVPNDSSSAYTGPLMTPVNTGAPNSGGLPGPTVHPETNPVTSPNILSSSELRQLEITINSYYRKYLGRDADQAGLIYYIHQNQQGLSLSKISESIRLSVEAKVRGFYLRYLNREPDAKGRDFWMLQAQNGRSLAQIETDFINSAEARIRGFYLTYLRREPDMAGLHYWMDQNNRGLSLAQIQLHFRHSDECKISCL